MGRSPCCAKEGLNRGAWTAMEDKILVEYINTHGEGKWRHLPKRAGLKRCGKSCRLRWLNYLRPDIKRGNITRDEEDLIIRLHKLLGNRWALIAGRLPGRTDNEIKNYWNTNIGKKLQNRNSKSFTTSSDGRSTSSIAGQDSDQNPKTPLTYTGSGVVRTKATRCTKVIVSKEAQQYGSLMIVPPNSWTTADNVSHKKMDGAGGSESLSPPPQSTPFDLEGNSPLDFMADFEMDENFFSDLLNMDISQPSCFENQVAGEDVNSNDATTSENGCHQSSPNSSDAHFNISDDSLHASEDLQSVSALMDNEFDWL